MEIQQLPSAKAEMLIRQPVAEVFEAFVDPAITARFWFTKSSGRLETGKQIQWDWEMYGHSVQVNVKAIEENKRRCGGRASSAAEATHSADREI